MFQIIFDSYGNSISLTSSHLIYVQTKGYINAAKVQIGDVLQQYSPEYNSLIDFKVAKIEFDFKKGFTAPLTDHGTLLVNNIHASCYAEINSHLIGDLVLTPLKVWYKLTKHFAFFRQAQTNDTKEISLFLNSLYYIVSNYLPSLLI